MSDALKRMAERSARPKVAPRNPSVLSVPDPEPEPVVEAKPQGKKQKPAAEVEKTTDFITHLPASLVTKMDTLRIADRISRDALVEAALVIAMANEAKLLSTARKIHDRRSQARERRRQATIAKKWLAEQG